MEHTTELEYVGFWPRVLAAAIDAVLLLMVVLPAGMLVSAPSHPGASSELSGVLQLLVWCLLPTVGVLGFWTARHATPGKMAISATIIDERTGAPPSLSQYVGRYFAYFASLVPLGLGFFSAARDVRKQGWHDKMAGTLVVRERKNRMPLEAGR